MSKGSDSLLNPERIISTRNGQVLLKNTLLKADHFPGCQNTKLRPLLEDAPNFRQFPGLPIFGVAIPTITGVRIVLNLLEAKRSRSYSSFSLRPVLSSDTEKVLWQNMREEPILYINGNPYVVREADKPFANLEYTGIDRDRLEGMEQRLKEDAQKEAECYGGKILLSGENDDLQIVQFWEEVQESSIQTPQDVFDTLSQEGYQVDYLRIPVTDEKAPKEIDCDLLVQRCWALDSETSLIFNCQMGRGRTTTGMIIAALLHLRQRQDFPHNIAVHCAQELDNSESHQQEKGQRSLKNGNYGVVKSLVRVLEHGLEAKKILDIVIDASNQMQNLREAIFHYRERLSSEQSEQKRNSVLTVALEYLERYCVLLAFTVYISHPQFKPISPNHQNFEYFMKKRPEFKSVIGRMVRRNPMSALGLHTPTIDHSLTQNGIDVIHNRQGNVLGQDTILKAAQFPGIEDPQLPQEIFGAPNFRGILTLPVYGVGMPTIDGIRNVLQKVGAGPQSSKVVSALWFNWREEPLVYINGKPYVLRELFRPFKNLKEYANIGAKHLEKMEARLKQNILTEAAAHSGSILVSLEVPPGQVEVGMLKDQWELIRNNDAVQTPAAVYEQLQGEGFMVHYERLPLTDGATPDVSDVDQIFKSIKAQNMNTSIIFNCQNGAGRTSIGMVIASLILQTSHLTHSHSLSTPRVKIPQKSASSKESDSVWQACCKGRYLGVRRLTRLLEKGLQSKALVDQMVDACDTIVNLRTAIGFYRMGMAHRLPEILGRDATFRRAAGYLQRYCFLIAVAGYLTQSALDVEFSSWATARKDIRLALEFVRNSPSEALTILTPKEIVRNGSWGSSEEVASEELAQEMLQSRTYNVLTAKSILKGNNQSNITGLDLRQVVDHDIYTIGNPSVQALEEALEQIGKTKRCIYLLDIREELVVYINGVPYTHRDLERPVSSLYQAGIAVDDLECMEEALKCNICEESQHHKGQVLLHEEISHPQLHHATSQGRSHLRDDITHLVDVSTPSVLPCIRMTESRPGDIENGICTPRDVCEALKKKGHCVKYTRVPLSRQRKPHPRDLDALWRSGEVNSEINDASLVHEAGYLVISRVSTGSSCRFTAAFLTMLQNWQMKFSSGKKSQEKEDSKLELGEYRGVMNLCRVLPNGSQCKAYVDEAIDACVWIGSLREDILACKYTLEQESVESIRLGLHYLKRYFFLIAFRCYLDHHKKDTESFLEWMEHRKELRHLVLTMNLE